MKINELLTEALTRRDLLKGAAGAAAGVASSSITDLARKNTDTIKNTFEKGIKLLSPNKDKEEIVHRAALASGLKGDELAQFMAQTAHETGNFSRLKEMGSIKRYARMYDPKFNPRLAKILGNIHHGDGAKYHGRGYIQLTGRYNYNAAEKALGLPLVDNPDLAEEPNNAAKIALWYWKTRVVPYVNNFKDTSAVTRKINSKLEGLNERHLAFINYLSSLRA